jgi:hypothetical protein
VTDSRLTWEALWQLLALACAIPSFQPKPKTWDEKVREWKDRDGTLSELLELARGHTMSEDEIKAQRESWARQDRD